jgi:protein PET100
MVKKGWLEVFKFGCYVSIPIVMTVAIAGSPDRLAAIIKSRSYVVYPPEGPRPPSADEMQEMIKQRKAQREGGAN